ncbi:MAG TPA: hypothetical protein VFM27_08330 [Acidimicrobiales bacterium]|nr:hypothetical protein [Acidimicrobiales bacterium]
MFDCLLGAAGRVIPDERWRGEVVDLARRSAAGEGVVGRCREVVSTAAFGLRLRSDHATGGHPGLAWRQGALLGAALLLATAWAALAAALAAPTGASSPVAAPAGAATVVAAAAVAASLVAVVAAGRWAVAVPLVAGALLAATVAGGWSPSSSALAVALGALVAAGGPARATTAVPGGAWWLVPLLAVGLAAAAGGEAVAGATALAATLVVPVVLVVPGGADARWAAAAAVAWAWRFLALDPTDLLDAGRALAAGHGLHPVLVRLAAMGAGVAAAVVLARHSARRASL